MTSPSSPPYPSTPLRPSTTQLSSPLPTPLTHHVGVGSAAARARNVSAQAKLGWTSGPHTRPRRSARRYERASSLEELRGHPLRLGTTPLITHSGRGVGQGRNRPNGWRGP